jgi:hypothetical protein
MISLANQIMSNYNPLSLELRKIRNFFKDIIIPSKDKTPLVETLCV